jgi:LacI family transcriptional regulator
MATIYDVATLAGVSPATVSRVFNGTSVTPAKANAVREAAKQLRFTPSRTARTLRKQNSEVIALVIPDIENPFFTSLARGVEDRALEAGYSVVLCNSDEDVAKELRYLEIANSENMAGVILAPASDHSDLRVLLDRGRPVVAVDRSSPQPIDGVKLDNRAAGLDATQALIDAGHRRIALITGPTGIETADDRALGWQAAVDAAGGDSSGTYLLRSSFRVDGGREAMHQLLALPEPPDAVVAANNLIGVGALQVLTERGLTPPAFGVSVIGDLPFTTLAPSAINRVHLPARHLGVTAAAMLLDRINGDVQPPRTIVLRNTIERASI